MTLSLHQRGLVAQQVSFTYFMPKSGIRPNSLHAIDTFWEVQLSHLLVSFKRVLNT